MSFKASLHYGDGYHVYSDCRDNLTYLELKNPTFRDRNGLMRLALPEELAKIFYDYDKMNKTNEMKSRVRMKLFEAMQLAIWHRSILNEQQTRIVLRLANYLLNRATPRELSLPDMYVAPKLSRLLDKAEAKYK